MKTIAPLPLEFRIKVDNGLFMEAAEALIRMQAGMQDNNTPLTPARRANLLDIISLAQGPND